MFGGFVFEAVLTPGRRRRPDVSTRPPLNFLAGSELPMLSWTHQASSANRMANGPCQFILACTLFPIPPPSAPPSAYRAQGGWKSILPRGHTPSRALDSGTFRRDITGSFIPGPRHPTRFRRGYYDANLPDEVSVLNFTFQVVCWMGSSCSGGSVSESNRPSRCNRDRRI